MVSSKFLIFVVILIVFIGGCIEKEFEEESEVQYELNKTLIQIFSDKDFEPYDTWEEIKEVLDKYSIKTYYTDEERPYATWEDPKPDISEYDVELIFEGNGGKYNLSDQEKKVILNTLTYFTYALDTTYNETGIDEQLEIFEICNTCGLKSWGNWIEMAPIHSVESRDLYTIWSIHEMAHTINTIEGMHDFWLICWMKDERGEWIHYGAEMRKRCSVTNEAFVPEELTALKPNSPVDENNLTILTRDPHSYSYYSVAYAEEDFAESVTAYRVSGPEFRILASKYPILAEKYNFIKEKVFNGREF